MMMRFMGESVTEEEIEVRDKKEQSCAAHCNENPIYLFPEKELCGLRPSFHLYVSVSNLYIPRISPHISWSRIGRPIVGIYKSLTGT